MTVSGEFATVPITSIFVNRAARQRKALTGIEELAASISEIGLIHPPVIERNGELRVGERRWTACKSLGWSHIPVQYVDDMNAAELSLLELEENLQRVDISWQEQCFAYQEYHALRVAQDPTWTLEQSADILGVDASAIAKRIAVADEIKAGNEAVAKADKFSVARGLTQRAAERKKASAIAAVTAALPGTKPAAAKPQVPLLHADFIEWSKTYSGPQINFLHCDFPYGISANLQKQGNNVALYGSYADGADVYYYLLDSLCDFVETHVADSAHIMFWFSMDYYQHTVDALTRMGFDINSFPLIWHKNDNTGLLPDPSRGPRRIYETALIGSRGDRKIVRAKSNLFSHPGKDKSIHMSEKPVPMLRYFFEMFVDEYSVVLDPTCGSGNALKAAQALRAASVLGLEKDANFYRNAVENYFGTDIT